MKNQTIKLTALLALLITATAFTGCRTMEGAGEDIQRAGENIEDAAK